MQKICFFSDGPCNKKCREMAEVGMVDYWEIVKDD